jgi:hypothetical protein
MRGRPRRRGAAIDTGEPYIDYYDFDLAEVQLEEAHRLLTLEEWKFTYLHSPDVDCFVNHCAPPLRRPRPFAGVRTRTPPDRLVS